MKTLAIIFGSLAGLLLLIMICYGGWQLERHWNYNLSYKSMVQETVKQMVKPEALK